MTIKHKNERRIQRTLLAILFALVFVIIAIVWLYAFDANPPIVVVEPLPITPNAARAGDTVFMTNESCKYTDAEASLTAFWQERNGDVIGLKNTPVSLGGEGCLIANIPLTIPEDMTPGHWRRVNVAEYQVNFLATRSVTWRSDYIRIVE